MSEPQEERRVIDLMGIRPITLLRWVQNKTEPRPYFLRQLLDALPQYRDSLLPLMEKEFPGVSELVEDEVPKEIPPPSIRTSSRPTSPHRRLCASGRSARSSYNTSLTTWTLSNAAWNSS